MPAEDIRHPEKQLKSSKEVGKNIKDKKETKEGGKELRPRKGVLKRERSFQTPGNTLTAESVPSLGSNREQHNREEK